MRYSSIIAGARAAGTSTPVRSLWANPQVGDLLAAFLTQVESVDPRAHLEQGGEEARTKGVHRRPFHDDFGPP